MLTSAALPVLVFLLAACSVGGLLLAVFYPRVAGASPLDRRLEQIAASAASAASEGRADESRRKRSVEDTLREAEERQKAKARRSAKPSLAVRIAQADLAWSKNTYVLVCLAAGVGSFLAVLSVTGLGTLPALAFGLSGGILLPHAFVNFRRNRRFNRFTAEFPNALDIIVRGIKSGLPLVDCLKIVAAEAQEPVKSEFKALVEDQTLGVPLDEAVQRLPERVPIADANFFAIVIAIQSRTGGSLSEALGNLSKVLRERKKMKAKIKAMSAEAKASGGIIGTLPVVVASLVYLTRPDYIGLLFTELTGNLVLAACGVWMLIGTVVMRKMINFDF
ncbi:MAG TPA: type II secretion system F family protein [Microvirga sp.]|nr:type II secretion system F family protein [Microvirga sp.]